MAIVTRYFGTSAAGAGDGTSWADRAALFSSGNWSSVITGFNFSGSDSLKAMIGPGSHSCGQTLAAGLFANAPTAANPLILHGCDASGVQLVPSNPGWVSAQPCDWDSGLPVIATTSNILTINLANTIARLLKCTASAVNGQVLSVHQMDWCYVLNSHSASGVCAVSNAYPVTNCCFVCSGATYNAVYTSNINLGQGFDNVRIESAGSSGNRNGLVVSAFAPSAHVSNVTVVGAGGNGILLSGGANHDLITRCTLVGCGDDAIDISRSGASTRERVSNCIITGSGGYGIHASNVACVGAANNRLRHNTSGPFNGFGNYPTDLDNDTDASMYASQAVADAAEYVNPAGGDYRIKYGSPLWGRGIGAGDEPAPTGGTSSLLLARRMGALL